MVTKKILSPFDIKKPDKILSGFLYPNNEKEQINSFIEISTFKEWDFGIVVYVGREITHNDVFAKIIDSGKKIKSVKELLLLIENYLEQVNNHKIGDIVRIEPSNRSFDLVKIEKPKMNRNKLP